mmetsp:Transcript_24059/g.35596  ORF Transcript_24059/g.35596 Transcript_24059/m.35596 type:complete len:87 (+) Transcript_24059:405-665(+)
MSRKKKKKKKKSRSSSKEVSSSTEKKKKKKKKSSRRRKKGEKHADHAETVGMVIAFVILGVFFFRARPEHTGPSGCGNFDRKKNGS